MLLPPNRSSWKHIKRPDDRLRDKHYFTEEHITVTLVSWNNKQESYQYGNEKQNETTFYTPTIK